MIRRARLVDFWTEFANTKAPLQVWRRLVRLFNWRHLADLEQVFPCSGPGRQVTSFLELPEMQGVDMVRELTKERGLRQKDLVPVFRTVSIATAVLNWRRELTRRQMESLGRLFGVAAAVFLSDAPRPAARVT